MTALKSQIREPLTDMYHMIKKTLLIIYRKEKTELYPVFSAMWSLNTALQILTYMCKIFGQ